VKGFSAMTSARLKYLTWVSMERHGWVRREVQAVRCRSGITSLIKLSVLIFFACLADLFFLAISAHALHRPNQNELNLGYFNHLFNKTVRK
jgi:hypothetical protein